MDYLANYSMGECQMVLTQGPDPLINITCVSLSGSLLKLLGYSPANEIVINLIEQVPAIMSVRCHDCIHLRCLLTMQWMEL